MNNPFSASVPDSGIALVWENFGPSHAERCEAVANAVAGKAKVIGIELSRRSAVYDWDPEKGEGFEKVTLFEDRALNALSFVSKLRALLRACYRSGARHFFFCHYQWPFVFAAAWILRLTGRRVYVMNDSKFDDVPRSLLRECGKAVLYSPYHGALSASGRTSGYMQFLGIAPRKIEPAYDARSIRRLREMAGVEPAPEGASFSKRHFSIVARFVPKKNLSMAIEAYRLYCANAADPRPLHLFGAGELEVALRAQVDGAGLTGLVYFRGFLQTKEVAEGLGNSLALILPSIEEQFGIVVLEALALGVPVLVSDNCGARDALVRSGVNGFVVEPDNAAGLAFFMGMLSEDEALWRRMSLACDAFAWRCDSNEFAASVGRLTGLTSRAVACR